jgi:hypothetical protein
MFSRQSSFKHLLTAFSLAACTLGGIHTIASAQGGSGIILFGNRDVDVLSYYLDFGGQADARDRYRLRIPAKKLQGGATKFIISYPDYFDGKFDTDKIEVRLNGDKKQSLALREVIWDEENHKVRIDLAEPLRESKKVEIVFSNVKNPDVGTYYFYAQVIPATNIPAPELVGAWVLSINP